VNNSTANEQDNIFPFDERMKRNVLSVRKLYLTSLKHDATELHSLSASSTEFLATQETEAED
jgi:hypothetical protein